MTPKQKAFCIAALRRASYRWPGRYTAMKAAHIDRNAYKCAKCENIFPKKEIRLDHIEPVVPVEGFKNGSDFDLHEFAERLLVEENQFQVLCNNCHHEKSQGENSKRRERKAKKKSRKG